MDFSLDSLKSLPDSTESLQLTFRVNDDVVILQNALQRFQKLLDLHLNFENLHGTVPPLEISTFLSLNSLIIENHSDFTIETCVQKFPKSIVELTLVEICQDAKKYFDTSDMLDHFSQIVLSARLLSEESFPQLRHLCLQFCRLGGLFKDFVENLPHLQTLILSKNFFSGNFPSRFPQHLAGLTVLNLAYNSLTGNIPNYIGKLTELRELDLSENNLEGEIPPSISSLESLEFFRVGSNQLTGKFPNHLCHLTRLQVLDLHSNNFDGPLTPELGKLKALTKLNLSNNKFSGDIPSQISSLRQLTELNVSQNRFSGIIPKGFRSFKHLRHLDLGRNNFTGLIDGLCMITSLEVLNINNNNFDGLIPMDITNLINLREFNASSNKFRCGSFKTANEFGEDVFRFNKCLLIFFLSCRQTTFHIKLDSSLQKPKFIYRVPSYNIRLLSDLTETSPPLISTPPPIAELIQHIRVKTLWKKKWVYGTISRVNASGIVKLSNNQPMYVLWKDLFSLWKIAIDKHEIDPEVLKDSTENDSFENTRPLSLNSTSHKSIKLKDEMHLVSRFRSTTMQLEVDKDQTTWKTLPLNKLSIIGVNFEDIGIVKVNEIESTNFLPFLNLIGADLLFLHEKCSLTKNESILNRENYSLLAWQYYSADVLKLIENSTFLQEFDGSTETRICFNPFLLFYDSNILKSCNSPILAYSRAKPTIMKLLKFLFEQNDRRILRCLVGLWISLKDAAVAFPTQTQDLNAEREQVEDLIRGLFKFDCMGELETLLKFLLPSIADRDALVNRVRNDLRMTPARKEHLIKKDLDTLRLMHCFSEGALLDVCVENDVKAVFGCPEVGMLMDRLMWSHVRYNYANPFYSFFEAEFPRSSYFHSLLNNPRTCPGVMFLSEGFSKFWFFFTCAILSVRNYALYDDFNNLYLGTRLLRWFVIVMFFSTLLYELGQLRDENFNLKAHFSSIWNVMDLLSEIFIFLWLIVSSHKITLNSQPPLRIFLALAAIPQAMALLQYVSLNRRLGLLVIMIQKMLLEVNAFVYVYIVSSAGFFVFFFAIFRKSLPNFNWWGTFLNLFAGMLGGFSFDNFGTDPAYIFISQLVLLIFLFLSLVVLLNLLIAVMSNVYALVNDKTSDEWGYTKAEILSQFLLLKESSGLQCVPAPYNYFTSILYIFDYLRRERQNRLHLTLPPRITSLSGTGSYVFFMLASIPVLIGYYFIYPIYYFLTNLNLRKREQIAIFAFGLFIYFLSIPILFLYVTILYLYSIRNYIFQIRLNLLSVYLMFQELILDLRLKLISPREEFVLCKPWNELTAQELVNLIHSLPCLYENSFKKTDLRNKDCEFIQVLLSDSVILSTKSKFFRFCQEFDEKINKHNIINDNNANTNNNNYNNTKNDHSTNNKNSDNYFSFFFPNPITIPPEDDNNNDNKETENKETKNKEEQNQRRIAKFRHQYVEILYESCCRWKKYGAPLHLILIPPEERDKHRSVNFYLTMRQLESYVNNQLENSKDKMVSTMVQTQISERMRSISSATSTFSISSSHSSIFSCSYWLSRIRLCCYPSSSSFSSSTSSSSTTRIVSIDRRNMKIPILAQSDLQEEEEEDDDDEKNDENDLDEEKDDIRKIGIGGVGVGERGKEIEFQHRNFDSPTKITTTTTTTILQQNESEIEKEQEQQQEGEAIGIEGSGGEVVQAEVLVVDYGIPLNCVEIFEEEFEIQEILFPPTLLEELFKKVLSKNINDDDDDDDEGEGGEDKKKKNKVEDKDIEEENYDVDDDDDEEEEEEENDDEEEVANEEEEEEEGNEEEEEEEEEEKEEKECIKDVENFEDDFFNDYFDESGDDEDDSDENDSERDKNYERRKRVDERKNDGKEEEEKTEGLENDVCLSLLKDDILSLHSTFNELTHSNTRLEVLIQKLKKKSQKVRDNEDNDNEEEEEDNEKDD